MTLDQAIGANLRRLRALAGGMGQEEFGRQMREIIGRGWSRQAVHKIERGEQPLAAQELAAAALVLHCTVAELIEGDDALMIGKSVIARPHLDRVVSGLTIADEGFRAFEQAVEALIEVRNASERYVTLMGRARAHIAASPELRERVEGYASDSAEQLRAELEEVNWSGAPGQDDWDMTSQRALNNNASPQMRAASDALHADDRGDGHDPKRPERFAFLAYIWRLRQDPRQAGSRRGQHR